MSLPLQEQPPPKTTQELANELAEVLKQKARERDENPYRIDIDWRADAAPYGDNGIAFAREVRDKEAKLSIRDAIQLIFGSAYFDDGVERTAERVAQAWKEFAPAPEPPFGVTTFTPATDNQLIMVRDIAFSSLCAHHLMPFMGRAHVGYIPNKKMVGLSKIPRAVQWVAKRPCTQEGMTTAIARFLLERLDPSGVIVVVEAQHTCMACRGIEAHTASMTTSDIHGLFRFNPAAKEEFLALLARPSL